MFKPAPPKSNENDENTGKDQKDKENIKGNLKINLSDDEIEKFILKELEKANQCKTSLKNLTVEFPHGTKIDEIKAEVEKFKDTIIDVAQIGMDEKAEFEISALQFNMDLVSQTFLNRIILIERETKDSSTLNYYSLNIKLTELRKAVTTYINDTLVSILTNQLKILNPEKYEGHANLYARPSGTRNAS